MRKISAVTRGSLAERRGLMPGDVVLSINGEALLDEIDYQALTAKRYVRLQLKQPDGSQREVDFVKAPGHPLGLQFEDSIIGSPRTCGNNCVFCFVDQLPKGLRQSLYLKDDDWRLSLLAGNFVTLTNVGDREFSRILRRKA
ncbi:MAG: PDZ domain-containing protein, partial [Eubacteriales bacterium]|nr:PDZ domain-containing protein [Eubacteriales bacterium]